VITYVLLSFVCSNFFDLPFSYHARCLCFIRRFRIQSITSYIQSWNVPDFEKLVTNYWKTLKHVHPGFSFRHVFPFCNVPLCSVSWFLLVRCTWTWTSFFLPFSTYLHLVVPLFLPLSLLFFSLLLVGDGHPTVNRESLQWVYKPLLLGWWSSPYYMETWEFRPQHTWSHSKAILLIYVHVNWVWSFSTKLLVATSGTEKATPMCVQKE